MSSGCHCYIHNVIAHIHLMYHPMISSCSQTRDERFVLPETAVEAFRTLASEVTENWFEQSKKYIDHKGKYIEKQ